MTDLARIVNRLIGDRIFNAAHHSSSNISGALGATAGILALIGVGFSLFAAHVWLEMHYRPDAAAAFTAVIAFGGALALALTALLIAQYQRSAIKRLRFQIRECMDEVMLALEAALSDPVRKNPKTAAGAAALAGFFLGETTLPERVES